jgi:hypothetical protein
MLYFCNRIIVLKCPKCWGLTANLQMKFFYCELFGPQQISVQNVNAYTGVSLNLNKLFDICGWGRLSTQNKIFFYYTFIFDRCAVVVMLSDTYLSVGKESRLRTLFYTL